MNYQYMKSMCVLNDVIESHQKSPYNREIYEMFIRIQYFLLNIIMDYY